jgi:hypothetical protein
MLLSGRELRAVFQHFCPFDQEGNLLDEGSRVTILAANVNLPEKFKPELLLWLRRLGNSRL